jgi:hypothetical protein
MFMAELVRNTCSSLAVGLAALSLSSGCASTMKQAAREAAPAAVKETVDEVGKKETRKDLATILADPRIREASAALTQAIVEGAVDGLTDAERVERLQQLTDAFVSRIGVSMARSLQREVGPQLSITFADAIERSLERVLGPATEERLRALALAATRSSMQGVGEALLDPSGRPSPVLRQAFGQVMRDMAYEASLGFDSAVRDARGRADRDGSGEVLASLATLSSWTNALPVVLTLGALLLGVTGLAALAWVLFGLRRGHRLDADDQASLLALARALRAQRASEDSLVERERTSREHPAQRIAGSV